MRLRARKDVSAGQKFSAHQVGLMRRGKTDAKQGARCRDARLHLETAVRGSVQRLHYCLMILHNLGVVYQTKL